MQTIYDVMSPTIHMIKQTARYIAHIVWSKLMDFSHGVSLEMAKQFIKLANFVKGKRNIARNKGSVSFVWREVAEEIERLKADLS